MHRPGTDPDNMTMADFLCDFCHKAWEDRRPMVEGHQGSLICSDCLKVAYAEVLLGKSGVTGVKCLLCLEDRKEIFWQSPLADSAVACARCIRQASTALAQDPDSGWNRPDGSAHQPEQDDE
ncbi:MAG: ClpX C4-type zinc finger protein [Phycisphaerales bacterium]